jgi:hypothetical protein
MIRTSDLIHLPYTRDLAEGGIAYALRSLPFVYTRIGSSIYGRLRRTVASTAVELAFRRYLSGQNVPFEVKGAAPFTDPDRYDVVLGGRRCDIKSFFISHREQAIEIKHNAQVVLNTPALVPSDQNVAEGHSDKDIYLFAFLSGLIAASQNDLQKVIYKKQPYHLIHVMPDAWMRPSKWNSLGALVLKSESAETQIIEIGGQDEGRKMRSLEVELPPQMRIQVDDGFFSMAYIQSKSFPNGRVGIHSPAQNETHIISVMDWGNIWVYGMDILLAGWLTRENFNQTAKPIREGTRVFQYDRTRTKNLAVPVHDLKPVSELLERVKKWKNL